MTHHRTVLKRSIGPICISQTIPIQIKCVLTNFTSLQIIFYILVGIHHLRYAPQTLRCKLKIVCNLSVTFTFLGSNQDNTVTGSCTIDSSRSTILQHFHRFNVIRIDTSNVRCNTTIYHIQRIARTIRTNTTNTDRRA